MTLDHVPLTGSGHGSGPARQWNGQVEEQQVSGESRFELYFFQIAGREGGGLIRYQLCCRLRSPCGCFQQLSVRKLRCTVRVHCSRTRLKWDDGGGYTDKTCSHTFHFKMVARLICIINMLLIFPNCSDTG